MLRLLLFLTIFTQIPEKSGKELTLDMHERFAYAAMMRTSLIHGYLDRARRHANQLADMLEDIESSEVAGIAREASAAENLADAADAVARVGEACGSCHAKNQVQPRFLANYPAPQGDGLAAKMGRHIWAADRMWEGLVSHSIQSWQPAAKILSNEPFFADGSNLGVSQSRLDEIARIASEAAKPQSWKSRAEVYGRFLAACSVCHQAFAQ